ncbi:hypothetical protein N5V81_12700 [Escherichia coli]|nr:hypothetical protein [Escherichia coli]
MLCRFLGNEKLIVDPKPADIKAWDDVEIRVDGRIRRVIEYRCGDLQTFYSTLDQTRKYLLHIPKGMAFGFSTAIVKFGCCGKARDVTTIDTDIKPCVS